MRSPTRSAAPIGHHHLRDTPLDLLPAREAALPSRNRRNDMRENLRRRLVAPTLRGVHHLALCTDNMKATIDFYVDVLGMPLVHAMKVPPGLGTGPSNRGNPPYERVRHYFFDMGNDSLLAFFEIPKGKEPAVNRHRLHAALRLCRDGRALPRGRGAVEISRHRLHRADCAASRIAWHLLLRPQRHPPRICLPAGGRRGTCSDPVRHPEESGSA